MLLNSSGRIFLSWHFKDYKINKYQRFTLIILSFIVSMLNKKYQDYKKIKIDYYM